jgi:DNA-binding NarL/FixJ family response regulator
VDPFYQEVLRPYDIPYICMTTVARSQGTFFGLCAVRSHREGPISERQKEIFASLAPHIRSAVRSQIALQGQGAAIVSAAMDALSIPVVARGPHVSAARRAAVLSTFYALTPAEIEIAQALVDGKSANDMADARAVSVGTVRVQLKTIMAKLGVSRQVEVLKRLSQL